MNSMKVKFVVLLLLVGILSACANSGTNTPVSQPASGSAALTEGPATTPAAGTDSSSAATQAPASGAEVSFATSVLPLLQSRCVNCHGGMNTVKLNPQPWLNEPRCDGCHTDPKLKQDQALYRQSKGHGGIYCEGCHDSTHAIATSTQPLDAIKFINLQGHSGTLTECTVCHLTQPSSGGPHN